MHPPASPFRALLLAALLAPAAVVHAQAATTTTTTTTSAGTTVASAVAAPAVAAVPPPACTPPAMPKGPLRSKDEADALNTSLDTYQKCVAAYAAEHRAIADAHMNAANGAVRGFNTFATELNAAVKPPAK